MTKRATRILLVATIVLVAGYFGLREAAGYLPVSFGYCVEAEFESLPPDDRALESWMNEQPGVLPKMMCRGGPENKSLRIMFIHARRIRERPVNLDEACARLGYVPKDRFRDNHENCSCPWRPTRAGRTRFPVG
ncbi:MAG: hypothetical protein U0791_21730 [Gemmataceae bacterium]